MTKTTNNSAQSQDQFWGGAGPQKSEPFEPHPLNPPAKTSFLAHLQLKVDLLADFEMVHPPPPGHGPANDDVLWDTHKRHIGNSNLNLKSSLGLIVS